MHYPSSTAVGRARVLHILKRLTRLRLQDEVLGNVKDTEWSVLIMDTTTTPVMSSVCRISEILDYGVSCKIPHGLHEPCKAASL